MVALWSLLGASRFCSAFVLRFLLLLLLLLL